MPRPVVFDLRARHYKLITEMAAKGLREVDIARRLGLSIDSWRSIRRSDDRAMEAWEAGRCEEHSALRGKLFEKATCGNGKDSIIAAIFLLKARHGYRDNAPPESHESNNVRITLELPSALTTTQYEQIKTVHPKLLKQVAGEDGPQHWAMEDSSSGEPRWEVPEVPAVINDDNSTPS